MMHRAQLRLIPRGFEDGLVVDLFAGGGGASAGIEAALGRPVDVALNHDEMAIATHERNHPNTKHLRADIWSVRPLYVTHGRRVLGIWGSPDCFAGGTLILTERGQRPIEAVAVGDMVLTHRGRWRRVTATTQKDAMTIAVRGHGHHGLVTTANHPFYSKRITKRYPGGKNGGKRPGTIRTLVENPYWPKAEDLSGKLWATPRHYPDAAVPTCEGAELSEDFFYLVGRWLGDGSINKGDVEICCGLAEVEEFLARVAARPLRRADGTEVSVRIVDHGSSKLVVWGNAPLTRWLHQHFGTGCEGKHLPTWCLAMQASWRRALLAGYVDADGSEGIRTDISSVSKALAIGARLLAVSLGFAAAMYKDPGHPGQIEGRSFVGQDRFIVAWRPEIQRETVFWDETHLFSPVREVTPTGRTERVYCLTVEEDESYVADGIVVHNCRHFSRAKGGVPRSKKIRSLANALVRWAKETLADCLFVENVIEFLTWGPLCKRTKEPIKARAGESFQRWVRGLRRLGYAVEWRVLDASLYGAPTRRKRLFVVARRDGLPIVWPEPTHGPGRLPLRTAAECIDWSLPCPSIFDRKKPLAEKTLWRIAQGIRRFVLENPRPFIVKVNHGRHEDRSAPIDGPLSTVTAERRGHALVVPTLQQSGFGERPGQAARVPGLDVPLGTVVAGGQKHALVAAFLSKAYGDPLRQTGGGAVIGSELPQPIGTVTARDHHGLAAVALAKFRGTSEAHPGCASVDEPLPTVSAGGGKGGVHVGEVRAFLTAYYSSDGTSGQRLDEPARTITAKHRLGLVTVDGIDYQIVDIGFRMLEPHELLRAQFGRFAEGYDLSEAKSKAAKVRLIGNSVCPELAEALIRANVPRRERAAA